MNYTSARQNETKVVNYLEEVEPDWKDIAISLMQFLPDDDVRQWAEGEGYDEIFTKKYKVYVNYSGCIELDIEAEDEHEAQDIAEQMFDNVNTIALQANIVDVDYEIEEE